MWADFTLSESIKCHKQLLQPILKSFQRIKKKQKKNNNKCQGVRKLRNEILEVGLVDTIKCVEA